LFYKYIQAQKKKTEKKISIEINYQSDNFRRKIITDTHIEVKQNADEKNEEKTKLFAV